jgi:TPR repeat protein
MTVRLFALIAAVSGLALASPALAQDPRGARASGFTGSAWMGSEPRPRNCRAHEYECGVQAYEHYGPRAAAAWFQRGARRGSAPAMRSLGLLFLRGAEGVRADPAAAMGWFYEAALRDDAMSMYALSRAFEDGVGVERDPAIARFWLERAAAKGYGPARRALRGGQ